MFLEEASEIKLKGNLLDSFKTSNNRLGKWKATYAILETFTAREVLPTVKSWIERIPELVRDYKLENG